MSYDQDNFEELYEIPDEKFYDELIEKMELKDKEFWEQLWRDDDIAEQIADMRFDDEKIREKGSAPFQKDKVL